MRGCFYICGCQYVCAELFADFGGEGRLCVCVHVDSKGFSLQGFFLMTPTREEQTQDVGRSCRHSAGRKFRKMH